MTTALAVTGGDIRLQPACQRVNAELFFDVDTVPLALHICRKHCPAAVFEACVRYTATYTPVGCVQAGKRWRPVKAKGGPGPMTWASYDSGAGCPLCTETGDR